MYDFIFSFFVVLVIIGVTVLKAKNAAPSGQAGKRLSEGLKKTQGKLNIPLPAGETIKRTPKDVGTNNFTASTSDEERYYESLKTLKKSGLLTDQEMKEMLDKHQSRR